MPSHRLEKLNSLIQQELGFIIKEEVELPIDSLITVSKVDTSVDIKHTNVYISVIPKNKAVSVIKKLNHNVYHLQQALNRKLVIHFVPKIRFVLDHSEEHAERIEKILAKI